MDDLRLEVCSDPRLLGVVRGVLRCWLEVFGLVEDRRDEVVLAVDEAVANAMRHAYEGRCDETVDLVLSSTHRWVEITVSDQGLPCPAERVDRRPMVRPEPHELVPGGLGVRLIHQVFDDVRFCAGEDRGNCVTMRMRRTEKHGVDRED
jgi:anti-sigma regulatory factor (Ser/Thr protein kinase)